jgi:23S rRNA (cytidine1920-2'-O)/16S rRNA (cytidine1409-2'-O)-methyltransferase
LAPGADVVALIKPQFELEREQVGKGGIVREPELHRAAVDKIRDFIATEGALRWIDVMDSPILGGEGNKEFLAWMRKNG